MLVHPRGFAIVCRQRHKLIHLATGRREDDTILTQGPDPVTDESLSAAETAFAYDRMVYIGHPFVQTHPDRLATIASLHGMQPAPVAGCRVLELGCGDGGNLIPMAYQWPDSEFVGVDLSARAVEKGEATAAELGLRNIRLLRLDIMDVGVDFGRFDYIIAHGVYSWVPQPVRDKMMAIFRQNLAPAGVAYVSFNANPGSHLRDFARGMMLFHVRGITDPATRVEQARTLLKFLAQVSTGEDWYGMLLRNQLERVCKMPDMLLYHDDLDESARAFFLHEVVEEAARHGLQYLSDASFSALNLQAEPEPVVNMISQIPEDDVLTREQYLDFVKGRAFRETLLCHHEASLRRQIPPQCIEHYHIAAHAVPVAEEIDPAEAGIGEFKTEKGGIISTNHGLSKAALLHLGKVWPRTVSFAELVDNASARLGAMTGAAGVERKADLEALTDFLFRMFRAGIVELHLYPPRFTTAIGERPQASLIARSQAPHGPLISNLRHSTIVLEDEIVRRFLVLVDGTRTLDQLVCDLNLALAAEPDAATPRVDGGSAGGRRQVTREEVERNLATMARLALLVA